jgi:transcriptional regulator with XRE-family HTH domain
LPRRAQRTQESYRDELPRLLAERGISYRKFAQAIGVTQSYLSRTLNAERTPSTRIIEAAAVQLGLPKDYFPEYREHVAVEALKRDGVLRDSIYDSVKRRRR